MALRFAAAMGFLDIATPLEFEAFQEYPQLQGGLLSWHLLHS